MTDEIRKLLDRQAAWQKSRAALPWAEKVRMAEAVREGVAKFKRTWPLATAGASVSKGPGAGGVQASRDE